MKKQIRWTKWHDPLAALVKDHDANQDDYDDNDYTNKERKRYGEGNPNLGPIIAGPQGIIPLNDTNVPSRHYNFWIMETNFNISRPVARMLNETNGVETLDIFTRYRARIAIGRLFDTEEIKDAIEAALLQADKKVVTPEPAKASSYEVIRSKIQKKYKYWAILFDEKTKEFRVIGNNENQAQVEEQIAGTTGAKVLDTSWDKK
jgi:hypothetical protein